MREVRWCGINLVDLQKLRENNPSLARDNLRQAAEIDRLILNFGAAELEAVRIQSLREDVQNATISWSRAEGPTGVGSVDTTLLMDTPLEIHLSQLYKISPSRAHCPLQHLVVYQLTAGRDPCAKRSTR